MAIYHLSVKPISRGGGRSATAAIAYRSAERVQDLSSGETFDYTRKRGVEHAEIVLPDSAAKRDIHWARDRQALWNAAEASEKRKDARVAREYEVALPHELSREQRVELVRGFAGELANRYGVAVDFAIHRPHRSGDERNFHAHVLTTTRQLEPSGLGAKASIEWSDTDRAKKGLGPAKGEVKAIRARWEALTNERLKELGIEARIDHRSLAEQGLDREPTRHLGPAVSAMERRGIETEVGKRISLEMASERLARAVELGRIERENSGVEKSILDVTGDLAAACRERSASLDPLDTGIEKWKREYQNQPRPLAQEISREAVANWKALREGVPRMDALERAAETQQPESLKDLTLEQIKDQGRAALEGVRQELQAERQRQHQRQAALEAQRERERSRSREREGPERDGPDLEL